jgi:hypothetical protein
MEPQNAISPEEEVERIYLDLLDHRQGQIIDVISSCIQQVCAILKSAPDPDDYFEEARLAVASGGEIPDPASMPYRVLGSLAPEDVAVSLILEELHEGFSDGLAAACRDDPVKFRAPDPDPTPGRAA